VSLPGGGALVSPFQIAGEAEPTFIGKPHPPMYRQALDALDRKPHECWMIGDRPETDILGAARTGMRTILVRTGRFPPGEEIPEGLPQPDFDVVALNEALLTELGI
jgi:4-nitrophenyl phosphatase/NagD protein